MLKKGVYEAGVLGMMVFIISRGVVRRISRFSGDLRTFVAVGQYAEARRTVGMRNILS
jgi:hypothetical protein